MKPALSVLAISGRIFERDESLFEYVIQSLKAQNLGSNELEGKVLAITSKIVSLAEGQIVEKQDIGKEELVKRESDVFMGEIGYGCFLTVKHGLFIPSAGIDESNAKKDWYILFPKDPFASALRVRNQLKGYFKLENFGIVLTDSHTSPLRVGVTGIALAHAGFKGVKSRIGDKDLFGRELKMTQIAVADALAVGAVFAMGEGDESTPLVLVESPGLEFVEQVDPGECRVALETDIYSPLYKQYMTQD